ncbi:chromosomal replication initiator protein DnaA [Candidatus Peregrinibacteria bacterium]|nr:chromosomal replication initiator protein DnaA [Candidatus Peregrinibacteria bacterium]MBI3816911.1 chromosomal replication initiator protein DnaA [Candidatus Peregrinibacteria bacterium]
MTALSSPPAPAVQMDPSLRDLWIDVLRHLEGKLQRSQFITWFNDTAILGREEGTLVVGLPLPMFLGWHMEHYRALTLEIVQQFDSSIRQIVYKVDIGLKDNPQRSIDLLKYFPEQRRRKIPGKQEVKLAEGIVTKILNPRYTLEHFIVGSNTRLAHAACQAVAMQPGGKYNPLFLYGGVGLGKTHLLQGTGTAILKQSPKAAVVYTTAEDFTNQVIEAIQHAKMEQFRRRYRLVDVLIIDDVQFLANKERTQEEFFHTFNVLYEDRKQIIISADRPPQELQLEDRLISRFERGMIADVSLPDYETRLAILSEKAADYEVFLDTHVLQFIAEHVTRNVRELEGILMQAVALYELEQRMPTIKSIAEIMRKLNKDPYVDETPVGFEKPEKKQPTFQEIMEGVSRYYSVSVQDMIGASRVREILIPRQIAMHLGRKHLRMSTVRLGEAFSNRDHTTVMNACRKIADRMQNDSQLLREIRAIEKEVGLKDD